MTRRPPRPRVSPAEAERRRQRATEAFMGEERPAQHAFDILDEADDALPQTVHVRGYRAVEEA